MAVPVLVRAYAGPPSSSIGRNGTTGLGNMNALPPISSYAFADILRAADSSDFQQAIDGIAEICAKNRMSLADEYASHLPPLGEITAANSTMNTRPQLRPGMRRALTSVPEASSGSSEGSRKSKKRTGLFGFKRQDFTASTQPRQIQIGSMGRTVTVDGTTALVANVEVSNANQSVSSDYPETRPAISEPRQRANSEAANSLQRLLATDRPEQPG